MSPIDYRIAETSTEACFLREITGALSGRLYLFETCLQLVK